MVRRERLVEDLDFKLTLGRNALSASLKNSSTARAGSLLKF